MATSNSDDDSEDDSFGAQSPPLTEQIASILRRYPDGGQILKELIQNADDAGATEVRFLVDSRQHPTDGLPNEHFKKYQGPALYAWNDATFKRDDWDCLAKIERSEKEKEVLKVGRFGLGFLSVFHVTDLPMIVSRKWVGIVDPHRQCISAKDETRPAGEKKKLGEFFKHKGHMACFDGIFGMSSAQTDYNATLFRFPLRQNDTSSKICKTTYNPAKVYENLFTSLKKEAPIILLFLKSITKISLYKWDSAASHPTFLFRIEVDAKSKQVLQRERENSKRMAESYRPSSTQTKFQLFTTTFLQTLPEEKPKEVHWLVLNAIGSDNLALNKLGMELKVLPWVGVAACLSNHVPLLEAGGYSFSVSANTEPNALYYELKPILQRLRFSQVTLPLSHEDAGSVNGQAFCFLPLPGCTALPVNIHGYFSVADNRRSIKWPAHDDKSKEAQWNHLLLHSLVAPAYAILLACRSSLLRYEGTLPTQNTRHITDPYAAWPVHGEVKNQTIWSELVEPTLKLASEFPLLWTQADGGKWVKLSEACYLPGSFQTSTRTIPPALAIKVLIQARLPVVSFPNTLCETLQSYQTLKKLVLDREVTPSLVREALKKHKQLLSSNSDQNSLYALLDYILSDDGHITFNDIDLAGIPLLPLMSKEHPFCEFQNSQANPRYVFTSNLKDVLHFLPGVDVMTVSTDMPPGLEAKLVRIAQRGKLQLRLANRENICSIILKQSIFSWCKQPEHISVWKWTPGCRNHPPLRWINSVWNWLCSKSLDLSLLEGLPLIPQSLPRDYSHAGLTVSLIEVTKALHLITLPNLPSQIEPAMFRHILKQLGFIVVEKSICFVHPGMDSYVLTLKPDLVAKQIYSHGREYISVIRQFNSEQKHALRRYLALDTIATKYYQCLKSLPIFKAGIGKSESKLVCLDPNKHILPPPDSALALPTELHYPDYVLCREDRSSVKLIKALGIPELSVESFCIDHLIPFAKSCCSQPIICSDGDNMVMWLLSKQPSFPNDVTSCLKRSKIIRTFSNFHNLKSPTELYDPHSQTLQELFDSRTEPVFPAEQYNPYLRNLRELGLKTWKSVVWNVEEFCSCIHSRVCTVGTLFKRGENAALQRSKTILKILLEHPQEKLWDVVHYIPFLFPQNTPPPLYPPNLQWYAQQTFRLETPEGMCLPFHKNEFLVGSVKPFLSCQYNSLVISGNLAGRFCQMKPELVIEQLSILVKAVEAKQVVDALSISHMVSGIYKYLHCMYMSFAEQSLPENWIWWEHECKFLSATSVVLKHPGGMDLEPYIYAISKNKHLSQFKDLFKQCNIKRIITPENVVQIIVQIQATSKSTLSDSELRMVLDILNWLYNEKYESHCDILIPTSGCHLLPPTQCTFDDRGWIKQRKNVSQFTFVHERVNAALAKYFGVKPLSAMIAPSEKLCLNYTLAGQHERVTQRIRHIVQDYETNIDIFKELIQNADDAGATEVKFLMDWRKHPSSSLLAEELKFWQGPSLLAYNNATFSDQDFQHICQVAGETKRSDPLKTGRFGVGFCAAYQLTDLPSFISRRYFTVFDPHTTYLGDRVSHREPGMRIDLIENQRDLKFYEDQFVPYQNIFGCKVFSLPKEGYNGTLFRFPFRNVETAQRSEISRKIHTKRESERLEKALQSCATELLLFLKHVERVSLFHLDEQDRNPGEMRKIVSIHKTILQNEKRPDQNVRTGLIQQYLSNSKHQGTKKSSFRINVYRMSQECSSSQWLLCSTIQTSTASKLDGKQIGLVPFAEVAVGIEIGTGGSSCIPKCIEGHIFCFLPLPIRSGLHFHVNGFFDVGKDRRSLSATDDDTFGSQWNKALGQDALTQAFTQLLAVLASTANLQETKDPKFKDNFLKSYYSLWNFKKADGLVPKALVASFRKYIMDTELKILWSEVGGGSWICSKEAILFSCSYSLRSEICQGAINMMIQEGYKIVEPPFLVKEMIKSCLHEKRLQAVYTYQRFCEVVLFPKVTTVDPSLREKHLLYLLEKVGEEREEYKWAKQLLQKTNCIPCQESSQLLPPDLLINSTQSHLRCLYSPDEGRFPIESFLKSSKAMTGLGILGMAMYKLKISDLQERALSVCKLTPLDATMRSQHILEYLERVYWRHSLYISHVYDEGKQVKETLWDIPFLLPAKKPENINIPWCTKPGYITPSETFHLEYQNLVFTQKPVVELPPTLTNAYLVLDFLGVSQNIPTLELVIQQLQSLVSSFTGTEVNDATNAYLEKEKVMCAIYQHLENEIVSNSDGKPVDVMKQSLKALHFIWQDGHFLSVDQVFKLWHHQFHPYLYELSSANKTFEKLFSALGVQERPSVQKLAAILKKIRDDHGLENPVSESIVHFVENVAKELELLFITEHCDEEIFLPDENRVMRPASQLAEQKIDCARWLGESETYRAHFETGSGHFVHDSIPPKRAKALGARPILDAILKDIEDDSFLDGSDYGQHEDLCDRLNSILKKYPADESIFQEFIQNADDARASEVVFVLDHRRKFQDQRLFGRGEKWTKLQHTPALCIFNNQKFSEADIRGIAKLGRGGKDQSDDKIGKFGIGFNVAYHITDCPTFISYGKGGVPENFCVFDPTCEFAPNTRKLSPGKRWKVTSKHIDEFADQFEPFLANDLPKLSECGPNCLRDFARNGFVVFRLPLTRAPETMYSSYPSTTLQYKSKSKLGSMVFTTEILSQLLKKLSSKAEDILLFLNHVHQISVFEITKDGKCIHNSTTTATIPALHIQTYKQFPIYTSECLQHIIEGKLPDTKSTFHQVNIFHVEAQSRETGEFSMRRKTEWLIQRAVGSKLLNPDLLQCALQKGLKPIGGVAAQLTLEGRHVYHIFCFLPLPLDSHLPVHVNGHFLVDDSRKHFERIKHEGLSEWNKALATCVIAPAYVELVMKAKRFLPKIDKYYGHLFPHKELSGELGDLKLVEAFYKELLSRNPRVLMPQPFAHSNPLRQWFHLKGGYFCIKFECKETKLIASVSRDLKNVLTALGMPITKAPNWLYTCCSSVDDTYEQIARIEPERVIGHLQQVELSDSNKLLIKENIQCLLLYCYTAYKPDYFRSVLQSVPLLLAANGSLKMASQMYESRYMSLLPEIEDKFIDPGLEHSPAGELLLQYRVIVPLPVAIVAQYINLPNTNIPIPLDSHAESIVKYLWKYLVAECSSKLPGCIQLYFHHKPIIPTCDRRLFPVCLCKAVISTNFDQEVQSVMVKLGCPVLNANFQQEMQVLETVTTSSSSPENVIQCLLLQPTLNCKAELGAEEVHAFIECVRKAKSIKESKAALTLSRLRLFQTPNGSFVSLDSGFKVFVMPTGIPIDGILDIQRHTNTIVLKCPSEYTQMFYSAVVPSYSEAVVGVPDIYERLVLPTLKQLDDEAIVKHLHFIHSCRDQPEFQHVLEALRTIPFIFLIEKYYMPSELYDPRVDFFKEFYPNELPPNPWNSPQLLELLGFKTEIDDSMWLEQAQKVDKDAISAISVSPKTIKNRSQILLSVLMDKICSKKESSQGLDNQFINFLQKVSEVCFICSPTPVPIYQALATIIPHMRKQQSQLQRVSLVCFKDSVFSADSDLAGLCKSVLPEKCHEICSMPAEIRKEGLCIEFPLSTETVVQNLCQLSEAVSTSCVQLQSTSDSIKKVKAVFIAHYAYLDKNRLAPPALKPLQEKAFILQNPTERPLGIVLVKKSQLTKSVPSNCRLEPFCYQVPHNLLMFNTFLMALGIPDVVDAAKYAQVLSTMDTELKNCRQKLKGNDLYMKVAENAYNELIKCLRHGDSSLGTNQVSLILLTSENELQDAKDLFYDDVPWYVERLPAHAHTAFKFVRQPLPDDKGRTIPPSSLGVRLLSAVVSENIHEDVKSSDYKCNQEELYALKKRTTHCPYKQKLLDTLTSSELFNGLCRMYWSENKTLPTQEFLESVGRLPQLEIQCIAHVPLKTVLCQSGKSIPGTECSGYFCHLEVQGDKECLYISPHTPDFSEDSFLKQLAFVVRRMVHGEIKNDTHIMAMFQCDPHGIPHTLDNAKVEPYNPSSARGITYHVVGDDVPLDELTPHDSLIILNFSAGELVLFHSAGGTLKYCEVVEVQHSHKVFEQSVQIRTQQVITSSDGATSREEVKWVSPLQLYKRLTPLQHLALFSKSTVTGVFATPVTLAEVPVSDLVALHTWLREIYQSAEVQSFSGLDVSLISIRLIGHLHYQLVLQSRVQQLFTAAVMEIQRLVCCTELPFLTVDEDHHLQEKFENLKARFEQMCLEGEEVLEEEEEEKEKEREDEEEREVEEGEKEEGTVTAPSSTNISADGNIPSIYSKPQQAQSPKSHISGTPGFSPPQPVAYPIAAPVTHRLPQRFPTVSTRRGYRPPQPTRFPSVYQAPTQLPKPSICIKSAKIWLEQAKVDFRASEFLLKSMGELKSMQRQERDEASGTNQSVEASNTGYADESSDTAAVAFNVKQPEETSHTEAPDETSGTEEQEETSSTGHQDETSSTEQQEEFDAEEFDAEEFDAKEFDAKQSDGACQFPALVCFLCHETAEKCLKGVHYAFCGLRQNMIDSSHLVELLESLKQSPYSPKPLIPAFQDCVNLINEHENKSRLPNYQIPPCAPAAVYSHLDASEAFSATRKLLVELLKDEKLSCLLGSIGEIPKPTFISTLKSMAGTEGYPETWDPMNENTEFTLMLLDAEAEVESEEYGRIAGRFLQTMPNTDVLKIERIQNKPLWMKYLHCSQHMLQFNDGILGEQMLFHGSSTTDPKDIYNGDSSFDMRFSSIGMWGKGNYFAVNASYSNSYAYRSKHGVKKMLVAWVLTGYSYCSHPHSYTKPPLRCDGGSEGIQRRYDSVSGVTGGSKVYITYENNRAYPAYLVTYR